MDHPIPVRIFGVPTACATGVTDAWRKAAAWARQQLTVRFGQQVTVEYYDLFSPEMDRFPEVVALVAAGQEQVPPVFVDGELLSSDGKVSVPDIRRRLEAMGLRLQR
ncbi:MAG: hypothetical protein ACE5LU_29825 [Anaerolineae bacterium]